MTEIRPIDFHQLHDAEFFHFRQTNEDLFIQAISTDSRTLQPGDVFWALVGERFDAHKFLAAVAEKKPRFAVVQNNRSQWFKGLNLPLVVVPDTLQALQELAQFHRGKFQIPLIGLTGSNGKTTTKEMIARLLESQWRVHKTAGNFNNHLGVPLTLLQLTSQHRAAIIEMGSNHPGEISALAAIALPNQALVTNVGMAHLEFFKNKEAVAQEKLSLFDALPDGSVIYQNLDDNFCGAYNRPTVKKVTYSTKIPAVLRVKENSVNHQGQAAFRLNDALNVQLQVSGVHNLQNAAAAAAVAMHFGMDLKAIKDGLESFISTEKRMQTVERLGITFLNDTYNSNPDSALAALEAVSKMQLQGKIWLVLGDMLELGKESTRLHRMVLDKARSLKPQGILLAGEQMRHAAAESDLVHWYASHEMLARTLLDSVQPGDLVLLKGSRGMQMEKILDFFN